MKTGSGMAHDGQSKSREKEKKVPIFCIFRFFFRKKEHLPIKSIQFSTIKLLKRRRKKIEWLNDRDKKNLSTLKWCVYCAH